MNKILITFTLICFTNLCIAEVLFSTGFSSQKKGIYLFGRGIHEISKGNLKLSNDFGDETTAYIELPHIKNKRVKVSYEFYVDNLYNRNNERSFSNFTQKHGQTDFIFTQVRNDNKWRKVSYTLNTGSTGLKLWLRLYGSGKVYIDNLKIEKSNKVSNLKFKTIYKIQKGAPGKAKYRPVFASDKVVLDFDLRDNIEHKFSKKKLGGNNVGVFKAGKYFHFNAVDFSLNEISKYQYISFKIYNPSQNLSELFFVLGDGANRGYWDQNNYKTHLSPGWNTVTFPLDRFVGERGSVKFRRKIDLNSLEKSFLIIDLDKKEKTKGSFYIDDIKFVANLYPKLPESIRHFDFSSVKVSSNPGISKITTQDIYQPRKKFGFSTQSIFWRVSDDVYAGSNLNTSIGVLNGEFKVNLPNGKYGFHLNIDRLGYWDVPFWSEREVYLNSKPIHVEKRSTFTEYLDDLLRFKKLKPQIGTNPYYLGQKLIFKPITGTVNITNGSFNLSLNGDQSGISLNELIIYPLKDKSKFVKYYNDVQDFREKELSTYSRYIGHSNKQKSKSLASFIPKKLTYDIYTNDFKVIKKPELRIAKNEIGSSLFVLRPNSLHNNIKISFSEFKTKSGAKLKKNTLDVFHLRYQYSSPDINHESYFIAPSILEKKNHLKTTNNFNQYFLIKGNSSFQNQVGVYFGHVKIKLNKKMIKLPFKVNILPYELPKVTKPVGFFGLSAIGYPYFDGIGKEEIMKKFYSSALTELSKNGFTTFTSLPPVKKIDEGLYDTNSLEFIFNQMGKLGFSNTIYSYGGSFLNNVLPNLNNEIDVEAFEHLLKSKKWPTIVYTFSDEAGGYSNKIDSDYKYALELKRKFPFLKIGGFSSLHSSSSKLNKLFDYAFYTSLNTSELKSLRSNGQKWGMYNGSSAPLTNPLKSFSLALYFGDIAGQDHYLDWHLSSTQNYPYYIFDGRENDINMFYPNQDGSISPSLKFEIASNGLTIYRKLKLLEKLINAQEGPQIALNKARIWLKKLKSKENYLKDPYLSKISHNSIKSIESKLNYHIDKILIL